MKEFELMAHRLLFTLFKVIKSVKLQLVKAQHDKEEVSFPFLFQLAPFCGSLDGSKEKQKEPCSVTNHTYQELCIAFKYYCKCSRVDQKVDVCIYYE